jgi:transmembrane sensor
MDELIAKYLAGEALPDEAIMLDEWLQQSPENEAYFMASKQVLQIKTNPVNTEKMYAGILTEITHQNKTLAQKPVQIKTFFTLWGVAASLFILAFIGLMVKVYVNKNTALPDELIASADVIKETVLNDGTKVALNKHATLTVVGDFNNKQRKLKLEGEAFFEVVHDDEKPFVIDAGGINIIDVGTAFNVRALPQSDSVFVDVTEGIVELMNESVYLRLEQNQSAVYIRSSNQLIASGFANPNINAYQTKAFKFKSLTLIEVVEAVNSVYGMSIAIDNPKLNSCKITVDFNNDSVETIVSIIAETLDLSYHKNANGVYVLTGSSCVNQ